MAQKTQINPEALNVASQMILKEIDLTGTDAQRKAKLDQFETDWKALTGATDLRGARFVGQIDAGDYGFVTALLIFDYNMGVWDGIGNRDDSKQCRVQVDPTGTLHITPLFQHLEKVYVYDDNTTAHIQSNNEYIQKYCDNLNALGLSDIQGSIIPIYISSEDDLPSNGFVSIGDEGLYDGFVSYIAGGTYKGIHIENGKVSYTPLATSTDLADKADKDKVATSLEAITIYTDNTPEQKAANLANIKAYEDNLQALGVDVTKGYMIPVNLDDGYHGFIMGADVAGEHTGVIKRSIYNYGGGWIHIDTEGTYQFLELLTSGSYGDLTTTAKTVIPAINEVKSTSVTNRADIDRLQSQQPTEDDGSALPLLCGQPPILFGAGTPKESVVPTNWRQFDPETGEGYNWTGLPSAIGQQYINTEASSLGRYIGVRDGMTALKWLNC